MARPRKFDISAMLNKMEAPFCAKGYEGTGYSDLQAVTGLGKGSMYAAFGDKSVLFSAVLAQYCERELSKISVLLGGEGDFSELDPRDRLHAFLLIPAEAVRAGDNRNGCLLCNTAAGVLAGQEDLQNQIQAAFEEMAASVEDALRQAGFGDEAWGVTNLFTHTYMALRIMARSGAAIEDMEDTAASLIDQVFA